jgi:hypothetical protein
MNQKVLLTRSSWHAAGPLDDNDGDGVRDRYDLCPRTPSGTPDSSLAAEAFSQQLHFLELIYKMPATPVGY